MNLLLLGAGCVGPLFFFPFFLKLNSIYLNIFLTWINNHFHFICLPTLQLRMKAKAAKKPEQSGF